VVREGRTRTHAASSRTDPFLSQLGGPTRRSGGERWRVASDLDRAPGRASETSGISIPVLRGCGRTRALFSNRSLRAISSWRGGGSACGTVHVLRPRTQGWTGARKSRAKGNRLRAIVQRIAALVNRYDADAAKHTARRHVLSWSQVMHASWSHSWEPRSSRSRPRT
jgi:hypothetical protein